MLQPFKLTAAAGLLALTGACQKGDPSLACQYNGEETHCAIIPARQHSDEVVAVLVKADGSCTVNDRPVRCADLGSTIRAAHKLDQPRVALCRDPQVRGDQLGPAMAALNAEYFEVAVECPAHASIRR